MGRLLISDLCARLFQLAGQRLSLAGLSSQLAPEFFYPGSQLAERLASRLALFSLSCDPVLQGHYLAAQARQFRPVIFLPVRQGRAQHLPASQPRRQQG